MRRITSLATLSLLLCTSAVFTPAAHADDDAKINARIEAGGRSCKNALAEKYSGKASMADISVELGATLKQGIDAGQITLKDVKKGLSFNWTVKKHSGYCNTDGQGNVTELVKQQ